MLKCRRNYTTPNLKHISTWKFTCRAALPSPNLPNINWKSTSSFGLKLTSFLGQNCIQFRFNVQSFGVYLHARRTDINVCQITVPWLVQRKIRTGPNCLGRYPVETCYIHSCRLVEKVMTLFCAVSQGCVESYGNKGLVWLHSRIYLLLPSHEKCGLILYCSSRWCHYCRYCSFFCFFYLTVSTRTYYFVFI